MKKAKGTIKTAIIIIGALLVIGVPVASILNAAWAFVSFAVKAFFLFEAARLVNSVLMKTMRSDGFKRLRQNVSDRIWNYRQQRMYK